MIVPNIQHTIYTFILHANKTFINTDARPNNPSKKNLHQTSTLFSSSREVWASLRKVEEVAYPSCGKSHNDLVQKNIFVSFFLGPT
jgi:hypothetical protein